MKAKYFEANRSFLKKISFLISGLLIWSYAYATMPDAKGARQQAELFFSKNTPLFPKIKSKKAQGLTNCYQSTTKHTTPLFVFQSHTSGFVIVAQSNQQFAVVGYSPDGNFKTDSIPPQLASLLKIYEDSLEISSTSDIPKQVSSVVTPLLDEVGISLNQFGHQEVGNCPTGCVATAFAQIMAYYKYPSKGKGSNCYTHATYGKLCADFGNTTYNWTKPSDEDYKLLSFHVGISMDMNYCADQFGSSPSASDYVDRIHKHFGYYLQSESYFGTTSKSIYIQNELDNHRPVYVELPGDPGHAVVLDGYDNDGLFHINFGWGGQYNGYYALNTNSTFKVGYKFGTNISRAVYLSPTILKTNSQDSLALVALHNGFNGTTGWDLSQPVFTWRGVLTISGRVVELNLNRGNYMDYKGVIPTEIGNLSALRKLNLIGQFDGELPASIVNLTELRDLSIYGGQGTLKARLPENIGNLIHLETLAIPNKLEGEIPTSFSNLSQLKTIDFSNGNLTGSLPSGIVNLTKLENLNLFRNSLSGSIPTAIGNLKQLNYLSLAENHFTGTIPESIGNLTLLKSLYLSNNQLSGKIPSSLDNCRLLNIAYFNDNLLEGDLPVSFGNLTGLDALTLKNNKLESLPNEIGRLKKITSLDVSNNKLKTLPDSLIEMTALNELNAQQNEISQLSNQFGLCTRMQHIDLSKNKLKVFPEEFCFARNLLSINFSDNSIEKFPANLTMLSPKLENLNLNNNNISGKIPLFLVTNPNLQNVLLKNNKFIYEDLPDSSIIYGQLGNQQRVSLSKSVYKVAIGDTVKINIKKITPFKRKGNEYYWCLYPKFYDTGDTGDFPKDSILTVIINEKSINNKYYCKVLNPTAPSYKYEIWTLPCLNYVATDTLSFKLSTDEEIIAEKYPNDHVVNSLGLPNKKVEDRIVTLVPPIKTRGIIKWQASADKKTWIDLSNNITQNDLKSNFISVNKDALVLSPKTPAWYRCSLQDTDCEPMYSDTLQVNPFGKVKVDSIINVDTKSAIINTDSIQITIPKGIHQGDFRITVVKLDNPPTAPQNVKMSSVYDVTVSFGNVFDIPLLLKFKNLPKNFDPKKIDNYKGVFYDDINQKWEKFNNGFLSFKDSTLNILTNHLTKLSWWWDGDAVLGFTHILKGNRVNVVYVWVKDSVEDKYFKNYESIVKNKPRNWRTTNTDPDNNGSPVMIQDIAANMETIITRFEKLGLETPFLNFNVYVADYGDDYYGKIGADGYLSPRGYFRLNLKKASGKDEEILRQTLAHEYMHYTQDYYMTVLLDNLFFTEVHAPLADRLVWPDKNELENPECESLLRDSYQSRAGSILGFDTGEYSIFDLLSSSWDNDATLPVFEKFSLMLFTLEANLSGCFLHYMRSYRKGTKLDIVKLLTDHGWGSSISNWTWRAYLNQQTKTQLTTNLGDEFDDYVRFLIEGSEQKFTVLDLSSNNPYNYLISNANFSNGKGTFTQSLVYNFEKDKNTVQKDNIDISVDYLAAKMVLLTNKTSNKSVIVNYKRKHDKNNLYKIYHGRYDLKEKKVLYIDISDSLEYNFILDPMSDKPEYKHQNIQFLLLVNKKCPELGEVFTTFNASFEITATPLYDITSLLSAHVESKSKGIFIHNYSGNSKNAFILSGAPLKMSNQDLTYYNINSYSSAKSIQSPTSYTVNAYFDTETRYDFENKTPGITTLPTIQNISRNMAITYDYKSGDLKIITYSHITNKYETTYEEKPRIVKSSEWFENGSMNLAKIMILTPNSDGVLFFKTDNTTETKASIKNMSFSHRELNFNIDTGAITSEKYSSYIDTDYSTEDVVLILLMNSE